MWRPGCFCLALFVFPGACTRSRLRTRSGGGQLPRLVAYVFSRGGRVWPFLGREGRSSAFPSPYGLGWDCAGPCSQPSRTGLDCVGPLGLRGFVCGFYPALTDWAGLCWPFGPSRILGVAFTQPSRTRLDCVGPLGLWEDGRPLVPSPTDWLGLRWPFGPSG